MVRDEMAWTEANEIADFLIKLAEGQVYKSETLQGYFVLNVGKGQNKNAVTVHTAKDRYISFFVTEYEILERLKNTAFNWRPVDESERKGPQDEDKIRFYDLKLEQIVANEDLFRSLVVSSINVVQKRKQIGAEY